MPIADTEEDEEEHTIQRWKSKTPKDEEKEREMNEVHAFFFFFTFVSLHHREKLLSPPPPPSLLSLFLFHHYQTTGKWLIRYSRHLPLAFPMASIPPPGLKAAQWTWPSGVLEEGQLA